MKRRSSLAHNNFMVAILSATCLTPLSNAPAFANTTDIWRAQTSGYWSTASNWTSGVPNGSTVDVIVPQNKSATPMTVTYMGSGAINIGSLTIARGNTLSFNTKGSTGGLYVNGTLSNSGTIQLGGKYSDENGFLFVNNTTSGPSTAEGTIILGTETGGSGFINGIAGTITFTNNTNNTIKGQGAIGNRGNLILNNMSTIDANFSDKILYIGGDSAGAASNVATHNVGLLQATKGGTLIVYSNIDNALTNTKGPFNTGTINAEDGSVYIKSISVKNQTLTTSSDGRIYTGAGAFLDGVTIGEKSTVDSSGALNITPTFVNHGNLRLDSNSALYFTGNTSLIGGGNIVIRKSGIAIERYTPPNTKADGLTYTLTNSDNTISGYGTIGQSTRLSFLNDKNGTLIVKGGDLSFGVNSTLGNGTFTNNGSVNIANGSSLSIKNNLRAYVQNSGTTTVDGTLNLSEAGLTLNGGVLEGASVPGSSVRGGTINGNVVNNGGTIHPGDTGSTTWGNLLIHGDLTENPNSTMDFSVTMSQSGAIANFLEITGKAALGGTLNVSLANDVKLSANEIFPLIAAFGLYSGDFGNFSLNGMGCDANGTASWRCQLQNQIIGFNTIISGSIYELKVANVSSVPLPAALPLFGAGIFALSSFARRKRK